MGCAKCGGKKTGKRCCLCGKIKASATYPWGTNRVICRQCKEREEKLVKERKFLAERAEVLLSGKDYKVRL